MGVFLFIDGPAFSLEMGQFSDPVATQPRTNDVDPPPPRDLSFNFLPHILQVRSATNLKPSLASFLARWLSCKNGNFLFACLCIFVERCFMTNRRKLS